MTGPGGSRAEVIVVGAGAAGAAAAFHLASRGRDVLLLDGATFPRAKPCGGGMAASVQQLFPFDLRPAVDTVIRRVCFTWALEDPVQAELPGDAPFWIVRRSLLDSFLSEQAVAAGARFHPRTWVERIARRERSWVVAIRAPDGATANLESVAVVVADGSESRLAGPLGLGPRQPRYASTVSVEVDGPVEDPAAARFDFGLVRHGFCWAFPRHGGYSIGLGTFIGREDLAAEAVLARLLPSLGFPAEAGLRTTGRLRIWDGHHPLHGDGLVLAGDAASLCDPFLAEGLRPALLSGCRAATAVDHWLSGEALALEGYTATMRQEWGESMAWGRRMAQVFYRLPKVGYQLGVKRPTAPRRIAQILSGEMGYGDIAQRVIRRLLFQRG
ncbi:MULTISPECIES: NAD(P)/FAD-dependent oxidoreductase [Aphanothece]|uniref:NAD(P)/FAD-dependent oxidoreductase n=1 Tax=Aphanothece TaxID=1121 RepID=UPI003984691A